MDTLLDRYSDHICNTHNNTQQEKYIYVQLLDTQMWWHYAQWAKKLVALIIMCGIWKKSSTRNIINKN